LICLKNFRPGPALGIDLARDLSNHCRRRPRRTAVAAIMRRIREREHGALPLARSRRVCTTHCGCAAWTGFSGSRVLSPLPLRRGGTRDRLGRGDRQKFVCNAGSREWPNGVHMRIEHVPPNPSIPG
jgi:hypothetical protein